MNFSNKHFTNYFIKVVAICLSHIAAHNLSGQWHTDFTSFQEGEVVYQVVDDRCGDFTFWAGVRYAVDGNLDFDQIVLGFNDAKGIIPSDPIVYPSKEMSKFNIHGELNLMQLIDPSTGQCDGYVLTFSADIGGGAFRLHYLRLDQKGNLICDVRPFENHESTDIVYDMLQDEDGSVLLVGSTYISGKAEMFFLRMDMKCNAIESERHFMMVNALGEHVLGYDIELVHHPLFQNEAKYVVSGSIGQYSMMTFVQDDLSIYKPLAWDLDADGMRNEKAIKIVELDEAYYIIGEGEDEERRRYTYFMSMEFDEKLQANVNIVKKYYFPSDPNFPTAVTHRWDEHGFVICGVVDSEELSSNHLFRPYLFEINDQGDVVASTIQHGGHEYGIPYDVMTVNEGSYQVAATVWNEKEYVTRDFALIDVDLNLENSKGCYDEVKPTVEEIELSLLSVSHDFLGLETEVVEASNPTGDIEILQEYCGAKTQFSCKDVNFTALIYPSNIGWQYSFLPIINLSVGSVIEHTWEIRDGTNTPIVNAVNGGLVYTFSVKDNYTVELNVTAKLPDGTLCYETALLYVTPEWAIVTRD